LALSKKQNKRLGIILSVMCNEDTPKDLVKEVIDQGFVKEEAKGMKLTDKGLDEKNRLCTLAGLNIKYSSEKV
tara:strand:- start:3055 stop:3273 length:219 start_codon:yes stop_codon:yes gene_type:complete